MAGIHIRASEMNILEDPRPVLPGAKVTSACALSAFIDPMLKQGLRENDCLRKLREGCGWALLPRSDLLKPQHVAAL
jgi:hypothetical protein